MPDKEKTEISFLKNNFVKLKSIANFLDIPEDEVINNLFPGLPKFWLYIAKAIDDLYIEKFYGQKQKYIKKVRAAYKIHKEMETIERKFNKIHSNKHFKSDLEQYTTNFLEFRFIIEGNNYIIK